MTPEGRVVKDILQYLQVRGIFAWRNNTTGTWDPKRGKFRKNAGLNGVADILGVLPGGRFLAIECKSDKGRTTTDQRDFLARISKAGGVAILARSWEDVHEVLKGGAI